MNDEHLYDSQKLSIKSWAEDDRPREKMLQKGRDVLTNAELIGILIGSGTRSESAVDLSKRILASVDNDINKLGMLSLQDLMKFKGIGEAKAISIAAALELGRRRNSSGQSAISRVTCSKDAFKLLTPYLSDLNHEQFYIILLNRNNRLIEVVKISQGGTTGTIADTKLIFKSALEKLANHIILAHNHPSGNIQPSEADKALTKNLVEVGKLMDVLVTDHLILAGNEYLSFADQGLMRV